MSGETYVLSEDFQEINNPPPTKRTSNNEQNYTLKLFNSF